MNDKIIRTGIIAGTIGIVTSISIIMSANKDKRQLKIELEKLEKRKEILATREEEAKRELKAREEAVAARELCLKEKEEKGDMEISIMTKNIEMLTKFEAKLDEVLIDTKIKKALGH